MRTTSVGVIATALARRFLLHLAALHDVDIVGLGRGVVNHVPGFVRLRAPERGDSPQHVVGHDLERHGLAQDLQHLCRDGLRRHTARSRLRARRIAARG
jgi:hypothetical protein